MGLFKKHSNLAVLGVFFLLIISGLALFLVIFQLSPSSRNALKTVKVNIDGHILQAEVVSQPADLYRGLSFRPDLCPDCAMLFIFSDQSIKDFVMRDMNFPLDIIFIDQGRIVNIAADLPPQGKGPEILYKSQGNADQVLEVNAGYAAAHKIKAGDSVVVISNH